MSVRRIPRYELVTALVLAAACGGESTNPERESSEEPQPSDPAAPVETPVEPTVSEAALSDGFPRRLAAAICDNIGDCCESSGFRYAPEDCRSVIEAALADALVEFDAYGGYHYQRDQATRCIDAAAEVARACALAVANPCTTPQPRLKACSLVIYAESPVSGRAGEACTVDSDCLSTPGAITACAESPNLSVRSCRHGIPGGLLGDACTGACLRTECALATVPRPVPSPMLCDTEQGLYCDLVTSRCARAPEAGEPCAAGCGAFRGAGPICGNFLCASDARCVSTLDPRCESADARVPACNDAVDQQACSLLADCLWSEGECLAPTGCEQMHSQETCGAPCSWGEPPNTAPDSSRDPVCFDGRFASPYFCSGEPPEWASASHYAIVAFEFPRSSLYCDSDDDN
jgi:hypothetical protein